MKKIILLIVFVISSISFVNANKALYYYKPFTAIGGTPNVFNFGYSYDFNKQHTIWTSVYGAEFGFSFNTSHNNYVIDSPHKTVTFNYPSNETWSRYHWDAQYMSVKLGYQFFSFVSAGVSFSWLHEPGGIQHETNYHYLGYTNTEFGSSSNINYNFGIGCYLKATLPTRYVSPFIYCQIHTNGDKCIGVGININYGGKTGNRNNKHKYKYTSNQADTENTSNQADTEIKFYQWHNYDYDGEE